jgi:nicotinamide mononucleotide (NMN) deamidase PncC
LLDWWNRKAHAVWSDILEIPDPSWSIVETALRFGNIIKEHAENCSQKSTFAMDNELIGAIHRSGARIVIAITGGGSSAIGKLLEVPGGSTSLLEALVPYSQAALEEFLGGVPDQFCSELTARAMGMASWMRARRLAEDVDPYKLVGVGMTASLVSGTPKKGEHRIHVGVQTAELTASYSLTLTKGARSRSEEEQLAAKLLISALGEVCVKSESTLQDQMLSGEQIEHQQQLAESEWTELLLGKRNIVFAGESSSLKGMFPGAFNPLHAGHREMMSQASKRLGKVAYEISITNVDKPPIDFMEIQNRLDGIGQHDVVLTTAPTFREKSALLPHTTFVVGIDTLVRIADPCYYHSNPIERDMAIEDIAAAGCRFLVFGRELRGEFCCLSDVELPAALRALCDAVPEQEFHEDVSSTELRKTDH